MPSAPSIRSQSAAKREYYAKVVCYKLFEIDTKVIWELGFHKAASLSLCRRVSERANAFLDIRPFEKSNSIRRALLKHYWWEKQDSWGSAQRRWVRRALYVPCTEKLALCERARTQSFPWLSTPSQQYNKFNRGTQYYYHIYSKPRRRLHRQIIPQPTRIKAAQAESQETSNASKELPRQNILEANENKLTGDYTMYHTLHTAMTHLTKLI